MFLEINTTASWPGSSSVCPGPTLTNSRSQQPIMQAPKSQSNGGICPKSLRPPPFGRYFLFLEQHCTMLTSSMPHQKMGLCENIYLVTTSITSCVRWYGCIFSMLISGLEISSSRLHYSIHFFVKCLCFISSSACTLKDYTWAHINALLGCTLYSSDPKRWSSEAFNSMGLLSPWSVLRPSESN